MNKLLSIIIPTYNMASLLPRCLESLVTAEGASDYLDVVVVNDGSKDDSLEVARKWEADYPSVIRVIDKPNGNYGSTINAALPVVSGKYVKVLDSDDYFDTAVLSRFLSELNTLETTSAEADIIQTPFTNLGPDNLREVVRYNTMGREPYEYGHIYDLDEVLKDGYIRFFLMHGLTYRTELLRRIGYRQTEGISYTDTEWSCYPTFYAKTVLFWNLNLYQYNLDRPGQTMDPKVIVRCISQLSVVTENMLDYYRKHIADVSAIRKGWLKQYFENRMRIMYKLFLLDMPREDFKADELEVFDRHFWPICQELNFRVVLWPENKLLRIDYIRYWHKHHKRWPAWFEAFNHQIDRLARWVYVKVFRR
jgi:glycosyltransferase involved in cell wall biosynthesis